MENTKSGKDKRKFERVHVKSKSLWNMSVGGAYIITDNPRRLGSVFRFEFTMKKGEPNFRAIAKVVRVIHRPNPKTGEPAGMGLQFTEVSEEEKARLRKYLVQCGADPDDDSGAGGPLQCPEI